tara:strand:+ start:273 stop:452 length:180 start_codon:yes stop_codon:yes gene_type:complete
MKKTNYKRAAKELMKILGEDEVKKAAKRKGQIMDVTEQSVGTVYQFTQNDLTIFKKEHN